MKLTSTRASSVSPSPEHSGIPSSVSFVPVRPRFDSHNTSERLREGTHSHHLLQSLVSKMTGKIQKGRRSIFTEIGLDDAATNTASVLVASSSSTHTATAIPPLSNVDDKGSFGSITPLPKRAYTESQIVGRRVQSNPEPRGPVRHKRQNSTPPEPWYLRFASSKGRPRVKSASGAPPSAVGGLQRYAMIALLIAVVIPAFTYHSRHGSAEMGMAEAGSLIRRETSPTDVCKRWAHQAADVNGTLYIYGGEAQETKGQEDNTWNSYFLTLDLNKDWSTKSPALKGLEVPDGPPAVANGYLWKDYDNLYLYGGQFADNPYKNPAPESLWQYSIKDQKWTEFEDPKTSEGNYSAPAGEPVRRAAEGAGVSVPELGLSWYFGGHLDWATVPGWSTSTDRVYLKSLLEFTHPGYSNTGIDEISSDSAAADTGAYRNITTGGVQKDDFPERADGVLVFVPGWGDRGVLIGMAGGSNDTFVSNFETLTVYDIASSEWYHQKTKGDAPDVRVNPCAVVASAPDVSSFQVYVFGGQNLQPFEQQIQYDDMYILTIPAFEWIKVDAGGDIPHARAGHTCTMRDGQMVVVGGYLGETDNCDDPGIYVFDASKLEWKSEFTASDHDADAHADNGVLAGSYGYSVPEAVQKVVGGDGDGSATVTTPAVGSATGGPFATGQPPVFTITQSVGPTSGADSNGGNNDDSSDNGPNGGLIAAGVIAGIAGALALYLGFCAWVYRRQISAYKKHLAVANRYSGASVETLRHPSGAIFPSGREKRRGFQPPGYTAAHQVSSDETFGWVGADRDDSSRWLSEPKSTPDEPTPSGSGTAVGGVIPKKSEDTSGGQGSGGESGGSTENLLEGQEPSFFSVVMGPRRALRVVNGMDSP